MQNGERFIFKIDAKKKEIENRHIREFNKLYRRIGNDLINIVTNSGSVDFQTIIQNHSFKQKDNISTRFYREDMKRDFHP